MINPASVQNFTLHRHSVATRSSILKLNSDANFASSPILIPLLVSANGACFWYFCLPHASVKSQQKHQQKNKNEKNIYRINAFFHWFGIPVPCPLDSPKLDPVLRWQAPLSTLHPAAIYWWLEPRWIFGCQEGDDNLSSMAEWQRLWCFRVFCTQKGCFSPFLSQWKYVLFFLRKNDGFFFQWISCVLPLSCLNIYLWWRFPPTQHLQLLHSLWWFFQLRTIIQTQKKQKRNWIQETFIILEQNTQLFSGEIHTRQMGDGPPNLSQMRGISFAMTCENVPSS